MKTPTSRVLGAALVLILAGVAVFSQQRIPTGGPIPDVRGFNNKITNPAETSKINVVVRHIAGKVFVIAGAGGSMAVHVRSPFAFLRADVRLLHLYR